jgi:hypothetical protein
MLLLLAASLTAKTLMLAALTAFYNASHLFRAEIREIRPSSSA